MVRSRSSACAHQHVPFRITNVIIPPLLCILFCESKSHQLLIQKHVPALMLPARAKKYHTCNRVHKSKQMLCPSSLVMFQKSSACVAFHTRIIHERYHQPSTGHVLCESKNASCASNPRIVFPTHVFCDSARRMWEHGMRKMRKGSMFLVQKKFMPHFLETPKIIQPLQKSCASPAISTGINRIQASTGIVVFLARP